MVILARKSKRLDEQSRLIGSGHDKRAPTIAQPLRHQHAGIADASDRKSNDHTNIQQRLNPDR
ncbi:hypothetical protein OAS86_05105, partial [Gammaproteobacteria bacterium]|nr:hypothetical protein [Gammaproteobacteria bacterium]